MSIPSVKGVEIGTGFAAAASPGNQVHDIIRYGESTGWTRASNRAGGVEGGITNGEPVIVQVAFKPIATMRHALPSADLKTGEEVIAHYRALRHLCRTGGRGCRGGNGALGAGLRARGKVRGRRAERNEAQF